MNTPIRLALTMGDPAGIGPEIIVKAAHQMRDLVAQGRIELKCWAVPRHWNGPRACSNSTPLRWT